MVPKYLYEAAKAHIEALESMKVYLRDKAIDIAADRDDWKSAYGELMQPPRWLA